MSTWADVLDTRARKWLNDAEAVGTNDWDTSDLLVAGHDGILLLTQKRPDARIAIDGTIKSYDTAPTAKSDAFPLDDRWLSAIAHYVCNQAFLMEAGDRYDAERAQAHWDMFVELLQV